MAGGFHIYHEAARALWEMRTSRLETMAREDADPARRRAAALTLRLKADFVTPQERGDERSSVTKLASALLDDPGFTMDIALGMGRSAPMRSAPVLFQAGITRPSGRSRLMWVTITAAVILLVMDVLATAGVPIPTPIGELIDHFSGSDESPLDPGPSSVESRTGGGRRPETETAAPAAAEPRAPITFQLNNLRDKPEKDRDRSPDLAPVTDRRAQGREKHQAQGREAHQAQGREAHQAQGRKKHQAQGRDKPRKIAPGHRKLVRAKDLRE